MIRKVFLKVYFNHTSFAFFDFCWNEVYFKYTSGLEKKFTNLGNLQIHLWVWTWIHKFRKSASSILQSFRVNTSILKAYFNYTLEFEDNTQVYSVWNNGWQSVFASQMYVMSGHFSLDFGENICAKLCFNLN